MKINSCFQKDAISEMSEQIDQLGKLKARIEKDKMTVRMQLDDTKSATDHVSHEKAGKLNFEMMMEVIQG